MEPVFYVGMQQSERRKKGCKENRKELEREKVVEVLYSQRTRREIVIIVSAFC